MTDAESIRQRVRELNSEATKKSSTMEALKKAAAIPNLKTLFYSLSLRMEAVAEELGRAQKHFPKVAEHDPEGAKNFLSAAKALDHALNDAVEAVKVPQKR